MVDLPIGVKFKKHNYLHLDSNAHHIRLGIQVFFKRQLLNTFVVSGGRRAHYLSPKFIFIRVAHYSSFDCVGDNIMGINQIKDKELVLLIYEFDWIHTGFMSENVEMDIGRV